MTVVPKVVKVWGGGKCLIEGERITVLRVGSTVVVDVISEGIVIETILPWIRSAPVGSREGEARIILGGGRDGICTRVVADGL